jgi:hypothetical protein
MAESVAHFPPSPDDWLAPTRPPTDDLDSASAVLNDILACVGDLQDDLHLIANRHVGGAPASSVHVLDLSAVLARSVLDWISRWPS